MASRRTALLLVAFVGGAAALLAAAKVVAGVGPNLPGPPIRVLLGVEERLTKECTVGRTARRLPGAPAGNRWRTESRMPEIHDEARAVELGGRIHLVGGLESNRWGTDFSAVKRVDAVDPATGARTPALELPIGLDHTLPLRHRGDLYVIGGYASAGRPTARAWRYRGQAGAWEELAPLRVPRGAIVGGVIGDRIYVAGGSDNYVSGTPTARASIPRGFAIFEVFDTATGRWAAAPPLPTPRHHAGAAVLDGRLYVVGGRLRSDASLPTFERFDPARNRWERLSPLPLGIAAPGVAAVEGSIVVTGGADDPEGWVTPSAWAFDPDDGGWRRLPDLATPRHAHSLVVHGDRLYAIGGSPCAGYGREPTIESIPLTAIDRLSGT